VCDDFFDLGGDSVLAMQLVSLVEAPLRVSLPAKSVYEAPTVAEFVGVVAASALASQGVTDG
jgi:phthiocerol/phenolphthiocerol synthesis type-I polyketide synthase E